MEMRRYEINTNRKNVRESKEGKGKDERRTTKINTANPTSSQFVSITALTIVASHKGVISFVPLVYPPCYLSLSNVLNVSA